MIDSLLKELPNLKEDTIKVNALNELAANYRNINPENGKNYANKALILAKQVDWTEGIATAYSYLGANQTIKADYENALSNYQLALKFTADKKTLSRVLRGIGLVYANQNNSPKALEFDNQSLKFVKK